MSEKPVPHVDALSAAYWQGNAEGRLLLQRCTRCDHVQFYPRLVCTACDARELAWTESSGRGAVRTFTVIRRAVSPAFEADVPYVVALVTLDDGPTMMTNLVDCDPNAVSIGQRVRVVFERRGEVVLPQFTPEQALM